MDLTSHAGFFLEFYEDETDLDLEVNPSKRILSDLKDVIYDKAWFSKLSEQQLTKPIYLMYRNIARPGTKGIFNVHEVRADITIIPPLMMGAEPVKTVGHFHPLAENGKPFPEIYQVLWGKAVFLEFGPKITGTQQDFTNIEKVNVWEAGLDEFVVLEAGGHVTINPSNTKPLVLLNLVYSRFNSIYDPVKEKAGGPYYYINKEKELVFIKNPAYKNVPEITRPALPAEFGPLKQGKPIYKLFLEDPGFFSVLSGKPPKKKKVPVEGAPTFEAKPALDLDALEKEDEPVPSPVPVAHGEGKFDADPGILDEIESKGLVAFTYARPDGSPASGKFPYNPNGAVHDIAGITDESGRILIMMPHPERAVRFTQLPDWTKQKTLLQRAGQPVPKYGPGLKVFQNAISYSKERA